MPKKDSPEKDTGHSFEDYFKRAASPLLVLHLLSEQPMYVYQMARELNTRSDGQYTMSLLYPVLYRLVKQGHVAEGEKKFSEDNRTRQYYEITPAGRDYLATVCADFDRLVHAVRSILTYDSAKEQDHDGDK